MTIGPPYDFRVPTSGDVPNVPFDVTNLANDVSDALEVVEAQITVPHASTYANSTDEFPAGSMQDLGLQVSLTAAPAGVYLLGWGLCLALTGGATATSGNLRIMANGSNVTQDVKNDLTDAGQDYEGSMPYVHSVDGADLTVVTWYQIGTGTLRRYVNSRVWVARVGTAA